MIDGSEIGSKTLELIIPPETQLAPGHLRFHRKTVIGRGVDPRKTTYDGENSGVLYRNYQPQLLILADFSSQEDFLSGNPNDPCFDWKRPCFGGLTFKNRGHWGSR